MLCPVFHTKVSWEREEYVSCPSKEKRPLAERLRGRRKRKVAWEDGG